MYFSYLHFWPAKIHFRAFEFSRAFCLVGLLLASLPALAQSGQIFGTVTDSHGAAVTKAEVQVVNQANGAINKILTDEKGSYSAPILQPGRYQIVVSIAGFGIAKSEVFTLAAGQILDQNITLAVEGGQTSIVVTAFADLGVAPTLNPATEVADSKLGVLAGPGHTSSFLVADLAPGVIANTADPYGLSFTRSLNVRGRSDFFLNRTINGLPLVVIVGGTSDLFDLENVKSERVYAGPMLANQGFGFSSAGGVLDQTLIDPRDERGVFFSQSYGADNFRRSFMRLGTGELRHGAAAFISGTISGASNWKGPGNAERNNAAAGYTQKLGEAWNLSTNYVHNQQRANSYLALTYAQTQNLSLNYLDSYLTTPTTNAGYFGYNYQEFTEDALFGNVTYKQTRHSSFNFSPYILHSSGTNNSGSIGGTSVTLWPQNKNNYGFVLDYDNQLKKNLHLSAGYWFASDSADPPPVEQKSYTVKTGATAWSKLGVVSHHMFNAPYAQLDYTRGNTVITGGLRYQIYRMPQLQYFTNLSSLPNVPYSQIFHYTLTPDPNAFAPSQTFNEVMPNAGVQHQFSNSTKLALSYSRKYARVDIGPQVSSFTSNEKGFLNESLNLYDLLHLLKPESDDVIDLIPSYQFGHLSLNPDFYFIKAHNKEVELINPATATATSPALFYYQSNASTTGYGLDFSAKYDFFRVWSVYAAANTARESYDSNTPISKTATLLTGGKQISNDPKETAKGVLNYRQYGLDVNFITRYISSRFGLPDDSQRISPYSTSALNATYNFSPRTHLNGLALNFAGDNLFNRKYIGVISINEDNLSSVSYYAGPSRTLAGSLIYSFGRAGRRD
jgi:iron complex outermembrane receptor protein